MVSVRLDLPELEQLDATRVAASEELASRLAADMRASADGAVDFEHFMRRALFEPELGYYMRDAGIIGRDGDFITAPEMGNAFARALASPCEEVLARLAADGSAGDVMEVGAGSGVMARDLLLELDARGAAPARYLILEASPALRERQFETLASLPPELAGRVTWIDAAVPFDGILVANEVLDALPVRRFVVRDGNPLALGVGVDGNGFHWRERAPDAALLEGWSVLAADLPAPLPDGYRSEWCAGLRSALAGFTAGLRRGVALFADYGYHRQEYYHPQRVDGTLLCHFEQRAHADPLVLPGLQDLTASVDFTAVGDAAVTLGLRVAGYTSQAWFLMGCGLDQLAASVAAGAGEVAPESVAGAGDLRRLLLPGEMGERIKVMALARDWPDAPGAFALRDQRGRL